ncbi:MAG TPA: hypothetical protein VMG80_04930 [Solirubrobacteraceae bacterium]|nr:hypothetical protein [Solirubrobacteraceae bacterium]
MARPSFVGRDGKPRLIECVVLYFDLLGVGEMARGETADSELEKFDELLRQVLPYPIGAKAAAEATRLGASSAAVFSDSVVQTIPVADDLPAAAPIFQLVVQVAQSQTQLILSEYFARGAITLDRFHAHDGLLFGPALVEAAKLEQEVADVPRIVLSSRVCATLLEFAQAGGENAFYAEAPVLVDEDGVAFVDYLGGAFQSDPEIVVPELLRRHRKVVSAKLKESITIFHHWSKYRWAAEYHNAICLKNRDLLDGGEGHGSFLIDSIYTSRQFKPLMSAAARPDR